MAAVGGTHDHVEEHVAGLVHVDLALQQPRNVDIDVLANDADSNGETLTLLSFDGTTHLGGALQFFLYDAPTAMSCRADEHSDIIDAIAKRDAARAEKLMLAHLDHIESSLSLDSNAEEVDLEAVFK